MWGYIIFLVVHLFGVRLYHWIVSENKYCQTNLWWTLRDYRINVDQLYLWFEHHSTPRK
jgi:hypothetical protein